jgi:hypothetical protein
MVLFLPLSADAKPWEASERSAASAVEKDAVRDALLERLRDYGAEGLQGIDVHFDVDYYDKRGRSGEYEWRYPVRVKWSVEGTDGARYAGRLEAVYRSDTTSTGSDYFEIGDISVREMNPLATQRAEAHAQAERLELEKHEQAVTAYKARKRMKQALRDEAFDRFRSAAAREVGRLGGAISSADVAVTEQDAETDHYRFEFRVNTAAHKYTGSGKMIIADGALKEGPVQIQRKRTVVGAVSDGIRAVRAAFRSPR